MSENTDGKIIHSEVEVSIDPNCTTAFMTISEPAGGGLDVTPEKAMAAIRAKGIAFGVIARSAKLWSSAAMARTSALRAGSLR